MSNRLGLGFSLALLVGAAAAQPAALTKQEPAKEARTHFELRSEDGLANFVVTTIHGLSDTLITSKVLLQDEHGTRFLLSWDRDYVHQTSIREIRQVGGTEYLRYTLFLPFSARTRSATQAEAREHPELSNDKNAKFELGTAGNSSISGTVDFWKDAPTAREWRSRARMMLSPSFLDSLEYLETLGVFRRADFPDLDAILIPLILYRTDCDAKTELVQVALPPDCAFDKKFGFDCSDQQKERAEKYAAQTPAVTKSY